MADFEGSLPIKTARDDEAKIILVDGASGDTATKKLSIAGVGDAVTAATNDFGVPVLGKDASGDYALLALSATGEALISATDLDIRDLAFATDSVDVSGSEVSLDATTLAALENISVSATDLDIRDLAFATDSVDVSDSVIALDAATLAALETVELGATTLAALETITVVATDLDIRDLTHASDSVKVGDGTNFVAVSAAGEASVELTNAQGAAGATAPSDTVQVGGKDGSGNLQTIKTDASGAVFAIIAPVAGIVPVCEYETTATVGASSVTNHDYLITDTKLFKGLTVLVGARGATKIRVGTWDGATFVPKFAFFQQIQGNHDHRIDALQVLGDGDLNIRIEITNLDGQSSDVYSNLSGTEE
jgi:hypothetical protein